MHVNAVSSYLEGQPPLAGITSGGGQPSLARANMPSQ